MQQCKSRFGYWLRTNERECRSNNYGSHKLPSVAKKRKQVKFVNIILILKQHLNYNNNLYIMDPLNEN